jgi:hypothetical protein
VKGKPIPGGNVVQRLTVSSSRKSVAAAARILISGRLQVRLANKLD